MTDDEAEEVKSLELLAKAIKFNHDLGDEFKVIVNPDLEIRKYRLAMTKLTLPQRFGLYKTPTRGVPKTSDIRIENPSDFADSTLSILERNPDHKVRGIFS